MIAEFVLIVVLNNQPQYVGHFQNCEVADIYVKLHYKDAQEVRCLYKEFINLPKDLELKIINLH